LRVAAFVRPDFRAYVQASVKSADLLVDVKSWRELVSILVDKRVDVAVIDPAAAGWNDLEAVIGVVDGFPAMPVLVYMSAAADTPAMIAALSQHHVRHIVLHPHEGSVASFREELLRTRSDNLASRFLDVLRGPLQALPDRLRIAVWEMFDRPHRFAAAGDLAIHANVQLQTLHRRFDLAGLGLPKNMFVSARLLRAHSSLSTSAKSINSAAGELGYTDPRVLRLHIKTALGVDATAFRALSDQELLDRLLSGLPAKGVSNRGRLAASTLIASHLGQDAPMWVRPA